MIPIDLSIVVPAYNEEARLARSVKAFQAYLHGHGRIVKSYELILVDDGSTDGTPGVMRKLKRSDRHIRIMRNAPNQGKGAAVKKGVLAARKSWVLFTDADASIPLGEIEQFLKRLAPSSRPDVIIGSKSLRDTRHVVRQPWYRRTAGRMFNWFVQLFAVRGIRDTQCGFKLFSRDAAQKIFKRVTLARFGFDVEVLFLARRYGLEVLELPVTLVDEEGTSVRFFTDALRMFRDVFTIRLNAIRGKYR